MKDLTVFIADDHEVVRNGMARLLTTFSRIGKVREAANGLQLLTLIEQEIPDAVILDIEMPVMGGIDASAQVLEHYPEVKVLILTMHIEDAFICRLIDQGVHGFLSKSTSPDELEQALYSIVDKDFYQNELVEKVLNRIQRTGKKENYSQLSARETEILLFICKELSPSEISDRLQISEKTFFNHRANILAKTGVKGNVGLLKYAVENGMYRLSGG